MFVPVHVPQPSERARDLGSKIADLIRIYKQERQDLSMVEVRQAMQVAQSELRSDFPGLSSVAVVMSIMIATLLAGVLAFLLLARSPGGSWSENLPVIMIVAMGVLIIAAFAVLMARRTR